MSLKVTAKGVRETLDEYLASDAEILKCAGELVGFYVAVSTGTPSGIGAGIALLLAASSSGVKAASQLLKRVCNLGSDGKPALPPYERFRVMFYAAVSRAYLEALSESLNSMKTDLSSGAAALLPEDDKKIAAVIKAAEQKVEESDIPFLIGVDPLKGEVPFYTAVSEWLTVTLKRFGCNEYPARPVLEATIKAAKERFQVFLASNSEEAEWIRNYLLVRSQEQTEQIAHDLASVRSALEAWIPTAVHPKAKKQQAWVEYRKHLTSLPDQKDSMYNEDFGVREVFIRPDGTYAISGADGMAGKAQQVADLGAVMGGLLSSRVSDRDLIILCGGPGSGKSTLCRVLASELANQPNVFPIFVRLRRLKEGSDIPAFLEGQLSGLGLIDRIGDLRNLKNVVIILDGFDELVMASRARLRQFFNTLREDHTNGALRGMHIIVSGRDTLFPGGEGLPVGSHVLTLLPFDYPKVAAWSAKWRERHIAGGGATFRPEALLAGKGKRQSALHHLVTWPLTLHLVARVHTSGALTISDSSSDTLTKAILYRSILSETANRQREQTGGSGRLEPKQMRELLRAIAWRMYEDGRDSMDPSEVLPIMEKFFPGRTEAELAELSEVAVVNSPEMTKGEQTGFEFVHKSFAEYLTAEQIAIGVARLTFRAPEFGSDELTWRMTEAEAAAEVARFAAIRLLTPEVQEMLEPMLGDFEGFSRCVVSPDVRSDGLLRVIQRLEVLLDGALRGKSTRTVEERVARAPQVSNLLEALANYAAGVTLVGAGAARQLKMQGTKSSRQFCLEPFDGAFWRLLSLFHAGGLYLGQLVTSRMVNGSTIAKKDGRRIADIDLPIKTAWLRDLEGFAPHLEEAVRIQESRMAQLLVALQISLSLLESVAAGGKPGMISSSKKQVQYVRRHAPLEDIEYFYEMSYREGSDLSFLLGEAEFVQRERWRELREQLRQERHHVMRALTSGGDVLANLEHLDLRGHREWAGPSPVRLVFELLREISSRENTDFSRRIRDLLRTTLR